MMHEPEKSDSAVVATKPANKAGSNWWRSRWSEGRGLGGMRTSKARAGHRTGKACHRRWVACDKPHRYAAYRQTLLVGAGCLNWARPDLCGGRPAMVVPTANKWADLSQLAMSAAVTTTDALNVQEELQ
jgi:hypothetical protein